MTSSDMITACASFVGMKSGSDAHRAIIASYNQITPIPRGYHMGLKDAWCAAFLSAVAHMIGQAFPSECGCFQMAEAFKKSGRWKHRSDTVTPGDIVFFSWHVNGVFDHVGIVESVDDRVNTVEGNRNGSVCRVSYSPDDPRIIGYGVPEYETPSLDEIAISVIRGRWGNGQDRKDRLTAAGYDYNTVQKRVNELMR